MLKLYPDIKVSYAFKNRSFKTHIYSNEAYILLQSRIDQLDNLFITANEVEWYVITIIIHIRLREKCPFFSNEYVEYLKSFKFDSKNDVTLTLDNMTNQLSLDITGIWHKVILYEVPLLSLVTECFFQSVDKNWYIHTPLIITQDNGWSRGKGSIESPTAN